MLKIICKRCHSLPDARTDPLNPLMWPLFNALLNRPIQQHSAIRSEHRRSKATAAGANRNRARVVSKRRRHIGIAILLVAGLSFAQYFTAGSVSWPATMLRAAKEALQDTSARHDAGWRRITDLLERLGTAREADPMPDFDLAGRVVRIADGDTVSVLATDNQQYKVRLFGIDTPERDQPHGAIAKRALAELIDNRTVGVVVVDTDDYGRKVGTLFHEGTNINLAMVASGNAWWYRHYAPHERQLAMAEKAARNERRGLWLRSDPVPPWDWRRGRR